MNKDASGKGITMKASFLNQKWATEITEVNKKIDISGWNQIEIHIDSSSNLRIAINSVQQASIYLGNQNQLSSIYKYSTDCWLGGGEVVGLSLRHLIFATGLSNSISDYSDQYAHSTPAPLDPYVLGYYALEDGDEISQRFQSQQYINIKSWNEPDLICHCVGSEDSETANYPHLGNSADRVFDAIPSLNFPKPDNFTVKVSFQFSMVLITTIKAYNHQILSHNGLWSLGAYSDQELYANITGVNETVKFDVSNDKRFARRQLLFKNQWMNYTFGFNSTSAYLIVNDLAQKTPMTLTYQFQNPIDLASFQNQKQGQFVLRPQSFSGLFSGLSYSVSEVELFNFKFSQDYFIYTSEPNLIFQDIKYRKNSNYQTRIFYGQYVSGDKVIKASSGLQFQQTIGPCNQSEAINKWDGVACRDMQKYFALNQKSSQIIMESYLRSTSARYTFETWFKFQGYSFPGQDKAALMSVYDPYTLQNIQLQISIIKSDQPSAFSIKCDPNANFDFKSILEPVYVKNLVKSNIWMHFSCVSNAYTKELNGILFDLESQNTYYSLKENSYTIQGIDKILLKTIIGNDASGTSPFKGFLREIRFWNVDRTDLEIQQFRYQTIPYSSDLRNSMIAYLMLNQGTGTQFIEYDVYQQVSSPHIYEQSIDSPQNLMSLVSSVSWIKDRSINGSLPLRICPPGTVFSQNCCFKSDFSIKIQKKVTLDDFTSLPYIQLNLIITETFVVSQQISQNHYKHEFSIVNVSNFGGNSTALAEHLIPFQKEIDSQKDDPQRQLMFLQDNFATNATYTFKAIVWSTIRNYDIVQETYIQVKPECPQVRISPKINQMSPIYVSKTMDPSLLKFNLEIKDQCVDPQIQITGIEWTIGSPQSTYILSDDKKSLKFKEIQGKSIQIYARVFYKQINDTSSFTFRTSDSITVQAVDEPFQLMLNNIPDKIDAKKNDLIFDPRGTDIKINFPILEQDRKMQYILDCPPYLFTSEAHMKNVCRPDPKTGYLKIKAEDTAYINYQEYNFTYTVRSDILGYFESKTISIIFYSEQYFNCPKIFFSPRTDYSRRDQYFLIKPYIYLDCQWENNTPNTIVERFQVKNIQWQVEDFVNPSDFLDIYGLVAMVKKSKMDQMLTPNFAKNVTLTVTLSNGSVITTQTRFSVLRSQIQGDIQSSQNGTTVPFNETMVLDVSNVYDPDYPSDELSIVWSMKDGQYTQVNVIQLIITPFDRLTMNLMDGPQLITVNLTNKQKGDELTTQKSQWINFSQHLTHYKSSVASQNCRINLDKTPDQYYFNQMNMSDFWVSGSLNQTSCFPSLLIQKSAFYIFVPYKLMSENLTQQYQQTQQIKISIDKLDEMVAGETVNIDLIYLVSYMESLTSKTQYDYIVRTVKITRTQSPIEVVFKGISNKSQEIYVGQESSITLDASDSFDIDNPSALKNFTYIWICPTYMFCQSRSSHLTITRDMRVERTLNSIDSVIKVGVQVKSKMKDSQISYLTLRVVKQDYSKCLIARLEGAVQGVLQIYRDQFFPLKLNLKPDQICANLSIKQVDWVPGQGVNTFWKPRASMQSIKIESASMLPPKMKEMSLQCQIQYEVYNFQNEVIKQQLSQNFTLQLKSPKMYVSIRTNQRQQELYEVKDTNGSQLILDASASYDREYPSQQVSCSWTCPQQAVCPPQQTSNCVLKVSDVKMVSNQSKTEIAQFEVDVVSQDQQKRDKKIISITLVSSDVSNEIPLCGIKQVNDREIFDIDRQMIFIPDCYASVKGQSYEQDYDFSWKLLPQLTTLVKKFRKLVIPSLSLYTTLTNRQAGNLTVSLIITSKNDSSLKYKVSRAYDIPLFYEGAPNSQLISFDIQPPIVTTLFTRTTITVQDYELKNNEYFRLRALKPLDENEILIDRSKNSTFQVYLPKDTIELFVDIFQDQRLNSGSYQIFSVLVTGIIIQEPLSMTKQKFQFQILPRLQTVIDSQMDFSDIGEVKKQLSEIKTLKRIISSIKDTESQPRYNSLMFNRIQTLYNNTVLQESEEFSASKDFNALLKSNFFDILANMFVESCANLDYQYQVQLYLQMMNDKLVTISSIKQISETSVELDYKLSYINGLNQLHQSQRCLNITQRDLFRNFSDQIVLSSFFEGDTFYYSQGQDQDPEAIFYKLTQLDREADNALVFTSLDNNAIVTTRSIVLPPNSSYLSYRTIPNSQRASIFKFGTQILSSEVFVEMRIFDGDVIQINPNKDFQTQIEFVIQKEVVKQISLQNKTVGGMSICLSRNDNETSFLFSKVDLDLKTDDTQRLQGRVKCISKHLSAFAVSYLPIDLQQAGKKLPALNDNNTLEEDDPLIFESIPLLKYLLPALFVVIILLFAVLGLIMSQMEFNRPKRLYNKHSITENLEKYNFFRLLACLVLQFNPIFNYVFKPNFYLTRPMRLLILANYFLLVSSFCLLYYTWIPPGIRLADIFWFGFALMFMIGVLRPKFQEYFFKLFYPKTLTNWKAKGNKYRGRMRSPRRNGNRRQQQHSDMDAQVAQNLQQMINLGEEVETSPKKRGNNNRRHRTTLFDDEEEDQRKQSFKLENSQRLQESGARLVDESYNREEDEEAAGANLTKGDEIVNFRDQKNRSRAAAGVMKTLSANQASQPNNRKKEEDSTVKKLFSKVIKNNNERHNNNNQEVEMTEIKPKNIDTMSKNNQIEEPSNQVYQKKDTTQQDSIQAENSTDDPTQSKKTSGLQYNSSFDRQSREMLRHSLDSNQPALESENPQNQEYAGFKFDKPEVQESPIHIDINSRNDISQADFDTSKDELNRDSSASLQEDYIYQDKNKKRDKNENLHYEGGDEEVTLPKENEDQQDHRNTSRQEEHDENEEGASPEPLRPQPRIQDPQTPITIQIEEDDAKPQRPRRRKAQQNHQVRVGFNNQSRYTADEAHDNNQRSPEVPENHGSGEQDESTPSLESVYQNYRELKEQDTSKLKRFVGILILLFVCFGLLVLHVNCLSSMVESQFSNWISCTLFTFMVMIFVIDTALYALVAWGLKRTEGKVDRRKFCSLINLVVLLPLGRWKYLELEIELAKMKDFDKEYGLMAYA